MSSRRLLSIVAVLGIIALSTLVASNSGRAIVVISGLHDFGEIEIESDHNVSVTVVNRSSTPARIVGIEDT